MIVWPPRALDVRRAVAPSAAVFSLGSAAIHFSVIGQHLREFPLYGVLFVAVSWFQAWWAVRYAARPTRGLARLGLLMNTGVVLVWAWSRTVGLPIAPAPGGPEAIGTADVIATIFEFALASLLAEVLRVTRGGRTARVAPFPATAGLLLQLASISVVVIGTTIALAALASSMPMG